MQEDGIHADRNIVQHNLRELLDSNLPAQISQLEESTVSLERVAAYCEANYIQFMSQNKTASLAETKRYALQSLASVAYLVGELSRSLLHALELEQMNLAHKTGEIQNITQLVSIQKEKAARREIGKLTTAKNISRQSKITYPAIEERIPRYQRSAIDFSILDGIGHGRRAPTNNNEYGSIGNAGGGEYAAPTGGIYGERLQINRTGSTTSGESGSGSAGSGGMQQNQQQIGQIYDHYARTGNHGTLTRESIRSTIGSQYRVPQPIPSALQHQQNVHQNHYQSMQQPTMLIDQQQQQRYASSMVLNGHGMVNNNEMLHNNNNNHYEYEQYGTLRAPQPQRNLNQLANGPSALINDVIQIHGANRSAAAEHQMNNSADYSDDGLPLPPPLLLVGQGQPQSLQQRQQRPIIQQDDGFPLPPPPPHPQIISGSNNQQNQLNSTAADWTPQQYLEKAICLYDYESRNQDELRLYQGAIVYVLRKNEDGWFEGVMDGITGLFPGNYVQPISN